MRIFAIIVAALVCSAMPAIAGTSGIVNGYIRSSSGAPLSGAVVKIISVSRIATTTSDERGFFVFLDLPPDRYTVSVEKSGRVPVSYAGIRISSDQTMFLEIGLARYCGDERYETSIHRATPDDVYSVNPAYLNQVPAQIPTWLSPLADTDSTPRHRVYCL